MPELAKQLTDVIARNAKPKKEAYRLASGNGLHLVVLPSGIRQWLVRYRASDGKRGKEVVGIYPGMTIANAHKEVEELHQHIRVGQ